MLVYKKYICLYRDDGIAYLLYGIRIDTQTISDIWGIEYAGYIAPKRVKILQPFANNTYACWFDRVDCRAHCVGHEVF